ncbi:isoprenoid synthase domain-containing protein [Parachaetomium inaequale]|uniref:Isoprenoid synthase domain-containing protein n=1 Tax=Parachaetomium inaequale TaxID=2588326 RepID=A0AAN6PE57_9PEZI|nr:isoprenoid synthase domain-containing protein [Parachaetomium inaequale]
MEFPNSHLVDPSSYDATLDGLCADIPLRVHRNAELADRGALRAQKDWQRVTGSLPPGHAGVIGPEHNFVSTCMPEILPDRLELVAYIVELAFLADDVIDMAESPAAAAAPYMPDFLAAYEAVRGNGDPNSPSFSPRTKIVVDFGRAMVAVDSERAQEAFRWVKKWTSLLLSRPGRERDIRDFDDYLEYRRINVSSQAAFGLTIFGMGLSIPEEQQQTCLELSQSFWLQALLANDYHSWERERKAACDNGHASVTNAIWVLMNKHSMTCDEAEAVCREKAKQYAAEYVQVVEAAKAREDLCQDAKFLLEALKFGISGNIVWGLQCPRYHADRTLNARQLEMANAIAADETIGWEHDQQVGNGITNHPAAEANGAPVNGATNGVVANGAVTNGVSHRDMSVAREVPALGMEALEAPSRYLDSLPGKDIRGKTIDALNMWYKVPPRETAIVWRVVDLLHGASLMLDDIQDSSQLRRGKPATHMVFGFRQTGNSAGYRFLGALMEVRKVVVDWELDELQDLYVGQSHDVSWTSNLECPTEEEYLAMVDGKTAGLFRMLARLLDALSDSPAKPDVRLLTRFMTLLGRLFQIRDDYMNLTSADYTKQKGFCEDLDEGKYSLPLIHALGRCGKSGASGTNARDTMVLRNLLSQRHVEGRMNLDQKKLFLEHIKQRGSLEYTRQALDALQTELKSLAEQMGMLKNAHLKALLEVLKV